MRWADLPEPQNQLVEKGFNAWQAGRLEEARIALEALRVAADTSGTSDGLFRALHLLACVAFSKKEFSESRQLHEQVLAMCEAIDFRGGAGSSLFDIGIIDQARGDIEAARAHYQAALDAYEAGGYSDPLPIVKAALDSLPT
jgi:tetratricopeptide (TPR) repeat protein